MMAMMMAYFPKRNKTDSVEEENWWCFSSPLCEFSGERTKKNFYFMCGVVSLVEL